MKTNLPGMEFDPMAGFFASATEGERRTSLAESCQHIAKRIIKGHDPLVGLSVSRIKKLRRAGLLTYGTPRLTQRGNDLVLKHNTKSN